MTKTVHETLAKAGPVSWLIQIGFKTSSNKAICCILAFSNLLYLPAATETLMSARHVASPLSLAPRANSVCEAADGLGPSRWDQLAWEANCNKSSKHMSSTLSSIHCISQQSTTVCMPQKINTHLSLLGRG